MSGTGDRSPRDLPAGGRATSRLRMCGYAALIIALCFAQSSGLMVADTKFDLLTAPGKFLAAGLHLWDPVAAFGQLQNQAYGYAWPMGPFFWLGHLVHLPEWVVQRLWWSLLLCLAFFGVVRLAQRLRLGSPVTQVVAGFAFVLTPADHHAAGRRLGRGLADGAGPLGAAAPGDRPASAARCGVARR